MSDIYTWTFWHVWHIYMAFEGHICCWQIYGNNMIDKSCKLFYLFTCEVKVCLYVDYSSSAVEHVCTVWHAYLFKGIC